MSPAEASQRVVAIGRDGASPEQDLFRRYAVRMRPMLELVALAGGVGSSGEIKRREAGLILKKCEAGDFVVALDQAGMAPDSAGLARLYPEWKSAGQRLIFVIGGAEGLERSVLDRADAALSLGKLTLPHMLARVVLAEQLYRAQCIAAGHPYHREGRP